MRSLFLKIFLGYWLTVVLVGLALVIISNLQPDIVVSRWRAMMGEATSLYAQAAAEELDRYGHAALANYLQRLEASTKVHASMFDEDGRLISGKNSLRASELVPLAVHSEETEFIITPGTAWAGSHAAGPSGRVYVFVAEMPRGPIGGLRPRTRTQALHWLVAVLVSGLICYLMTRYLTTPILRLRAAARQLAAGELSARAESKMEKRRDEIGELVRDFNDMAERIESLVASQKQLISDISHELRSPLARLNVAMGLARQRAGAEAGTALDRIERESDRLNEMIGRLLTLARLDSASMPAENALNLSEILQEIVADAEFEAQEHNRAVWLEAPQICNVEGSAELLRSAIENVVRNAIRYTPENTSVVVTLACAEPEAVLTVRDHGPGVPESELSNLFRPFYRVADARERSTGGTGLGLAITERAIRLHGGSVLADNAVDGGLIVQIRLPLRRNRSQRERGGALASSHVRA